MNAVNVHCDTACLHPLLLGGGGNQREGVINAVLVALSKGIRCLVLPSVKLVAVRSQEHGVIGRTNYPEPFSNRSQWPRFSMLFDEDFFTKQMGRLGVCVVTQPASGAEVVNLSHTWPRFRGRLLSWETAIRLVANASLQSEHEARAIREAREFRAAEAANASRFAPRPLVFVMHTDYRFRVTRGENAACWRLGPLCGFATRAVRSSPFITHTARQLMVRLRARHLHVRVWHAIHLRAWGFAMSCQPKEGNVDAILAQVRRADPASLTSLTLAWLGHTAPRCHILWSHSLMTPTHAR